MRLAAGEPHTGTRTQHPPPLITRTTTTAAATAGTLAEPAATVSTTTTTTTEAPTTTRSTSATAQTTAAGAVVDAETRTPTPATSTPATMAALSLWVSLQAVRAWLEVSLLHTFSVRECCQPRLLCFSTSALFCVCAFTSPLHSAMYPMPMWVSTHRFSCPPTYLRDCSKRLCARGVSRVLCTAPCAFVAPVRIVFTSNGFCTTRFTHRIFHSVAPSPLLNYFHIYPLLLLHPNSHTPSPYHSLCIIHYISALSLSMFLSLSHSHPLEMAS